MNALLTALLVFAVVGVVVVVILQIGDPFGDETDPGRIPTYSEAVPSGFSAPEISSNVLDIRDAQRLLEPRLGVVRVADAIVEEACPTKHQTCVAQALLLWTRSAITYQDALLVRNHVLSPEETILYREGDSRTLSVLLASLLRAEGIDSRIGVTPYVTFVEANVSGSVTRLDPGCSACRIGTTRYNGPEEHIVWVS